ncbi:MAG: DUF362 domain-containing protein [Nanoarchaeota archaeon]|nr:DUF362 domain-containing protein [Nanoarchaeota archaeon]
MSKVIICKHKNIKERTIKSLTLLKPKLPANGSTILIKPNLVEPMPKESGAITRPEIVEGIIEFFSTQGNYKFIIGESSSGYNTKTCFDIAGYTKTFKKKNIKLINFDDGGYILTNINNKLWNRVYVTNYLFNVDYIISVAVLKEHSLVGVTLSIKNMMGTLKSIGKFPNKQYTHKEKIKKQEKLNSRLCDLLSIRKPNLGVIDGTTGMYGSHINGKLKQMDLTCVGEDIVFLDKVCASILGHKSIYHIQLAGERGLGSLKGEVINYEF